MLERKQVDSMASDFNERVYALVRQIPSGKVASYGQLAFLAGNPRSARIVGYAMRRTPDGSDIPCHRVVFRDGSLCGGLAFGGGDFQRQMLAAEGVTFDQEGRVNMDKHRWEGPGVGP